MDTSEKSYMKCYAEIYPMRSTAVADTLNENFSNSKKKKSTNDCNSAYFSSSSSWGTRNPKNYKCTFYYFLVKIFHKMREKADNYMNEKIFKSKERKTSESTTDLLKHMNAYDTNYLGVKTSIKSSNWVKNFVNPQYNNSMNVCLSTGRLSMTNPQSLKSSVQNSIEFCNKNPYNISKKHKNKKKILNIKLTTKVKSSLDIKNDVSSYNKKFARTNRPSIETSNIKKTLTVKNDEDKKLIFETKKIKWYDIRPRLIINKYYMKNFMLNCISNKNTQTLSNICKTVNSSLNKLNNPDYAINNSIFNADLNNKQGIERTNSLPKDLLKSKLKESKHPIVINMSKYKLVKINPV